MSRRLTSLMLLAGAVTFACGGEKPAPAPAATAAAPATTVAPAAAAPAAAGDSIGVPECDDFLRKYEACVNQHVPAATKATYQEGMVQWRKTWKSIAAQPAARASLVGVCQQALATTKTSMSAHGCQW